MIRSFRHRGLRRLFEQGDRSRIRAEQLAKVQRVLARLDALRAIDEMDLPGFRLHALHGDLAGFWSISITGNWRIVFRFEGGDVFEVDYLDYR
ncbi:MAG: type II toxin-antitoxin system RelE/ParE family toxin [Rhizobiales bacterium]|nr:type II toxin-antitoxin system RelE/ParE family toxin [Hyphomicrobiales bacterium]